MTIEVELHLRIVSEANAHTHWRRRQKRAAEQRAMARLAIAPRVAAWREMLTCPVRPLACFEPQLVVTLTRIAPRELDDDNNVGAHKHIRDGIADALGVNDRDKRITWRYGQQRGAPLQYAVRVVLEAVESQKHG